MIKLEKKDYQKAESSLARVSINNLFARSVIKHHVDGIVHADSDSKPSAFHVVHPYGMSLLFGSTANRSFNRQFTKYMLNRTERLNRSEWLQAYPERWNHLISKMLANKLVKVSGEICVEKETSVFEFSRVLFKFDPNLFIRNKVVFRFPGINIRRTDPDVFQTMSGHVIPRFFWKDASQFSRNGIGFSAYTNNNAISTAFSSFLHGNKLEIGIETVPEFRQQGLAIATCSALIDYCLKNKLEPVWSCNLQNRGSYHLALRLGFIPVKTLPYYRLP